MGLAATPSNHDPHRPRRAPWEALHTALYWAQGSPSGLDTPEPTEAWVMQAKAMRNYHLHHPFDDSPAALPWPSNPPGDRAQAHRPHAQPRESEHANAGRTPTKGSGPASNAPLLQTPRPPSPATSSPNEADETQKGRTCPQPSRKSSDLPTPRTPSDPPSKPHQASSSSSLPSLPPRHPDQASSSSSLPPPAPPPPEAYPGFEKGPKVQQPVRNDHTGD